MRSPCGAIAYITGIPDIGTEDAAAGWQLTTRSSPTRRTADLLPDGSWASKGLQGNFLGGSGYLLRLWLIAMAFWSAAFACARSPSSASTNAIRRYAVDACGLMAMIWRQTAI